MATSNITLDVIPQPWANGGQHASIPDAATGTNRASFTEGWGVITSTPIDDGGVPPNRLDFNGLGYLATAVAYFLQNGGFYTFNSEVSTKIGGYPKGAILWRLDGSGNPWCMVESLVNNNTTSNLADTSKWRPITLNPRGFAMSGTLTDANAAQVRNIQIVNQEPTTGVNGTIYCILKNQ